MIADPYQVLGIDPSADSEAIRKRYLALVREFSPERAPERFAEIRAAYETLRDPVTSLGMRLFDVRFTETFDKLIADEKQQFCGKRIGTDVLLSLADV
ncbi:MAG: J domain-containing protein [Planctomycetaceae bacterium]|nr:MAG: J domain-containing protein [Planctomycetaceae bacterium]